MRFRRLILLPLIVTLLLAAKTAYALWVEYQLSPKALAQGNRVFSVKSQPRPDKELHQYEIVVRSLPGTYRERISPFTTGYLSLNSETGRVAHLPIEGKREGNQVTYWFRVAAESVPHSRFEVHESNFTTMRNAKGETHDEIQMGGALYTMRLKDFPTGNYGERPASQ
jgi:hypothetical protein